MKLRVLLAVQEKCSALLVLAAIMVLRLAEGSPAPPSPIPAPPILLWTGDGSQEMGRSSSDGDSADADARLSTHSPQNHRPADAFHITPDYDFLRTDDTIPATLSEPSVGERMLFRRYYYNVEPTRRLRDAAEERFSYDNTPVAHRLPDEPILDMLRPQQLYDGAERAEPFTRRSAAVVAKRALMRLGKRSVMRLGKRGKMRLGK